jgi:hypothetical protein
MKWHMPVSRGIVNSRDTRLIVGAIVNMSEDMDIKIFKQK